MKKKKKKGNGPRRKRLNKAARLQSARTTAWIENYTGKNIIRGYRNWYGVDELCAIIELRELGVPIPPERETEARESAARRAVLSAERKRRKQELEAVEFDPDSDDTYAYIAGYTSGGFPYGVTWEEFERIEKREPSPRNSKMPTTMTAHQAALSSVRLRSQK